MVEGRTYRPVIQPERCHTCDVCLRGCPAEFIPEYRKEEKSLRGTLYGGKTKRRSSIPLPPCQDACPIQQDTKGYVALVAKGKFKEALELIREVNPLPAVCGFICHHPCEEACLRTEVDEPIPIRLLKRFVAEYERNETRPLRRLKKKRREKILVIGSGPAGLTAANDLRLLGFGVTVFEALPVSGGMLRVGIPEFRLPRDILQMEIDGIRALGVEIRTRHRFLLEEKNGRGLRKLGFQAAFLSIGAHQSLSLNIPGEKLQGVLSGVEFLRETSLGKKFRIGKRVAVIGGGNVAVDVGRSALRLGGEEVQLFCIESEKEMPAIPGELAESKQEGVRINTLVSPLRIVGKRGKVIGMELVRLNSGRMDERGKIEIVPVEGSNFRVEADQIITAIGQRVDRIGLKGFETNPNGTIRIDPETGETSINGVFAGGDAVTGPAWAIDAIAAGKKGAKAIDRYLS
ncbi:MAG: FAD-dependent oxidoreductase [Thermodesulfobacteriota bacterium]